MKLLLSGWTAPLNKVGLNRLLREEAELGLSDAHDLVTRLVAGETIEVEASEGQAAEIWRRARATGVRMVRDASRPHIVLGGLLGSLLSEESARRMHHGLLWHRARGARCTLCGEAVTENPYRRVESDRRKL